MSDRFRRWMGIFFLFACVILSFVPVLSPQREKEFRFMSGNHRYRVIQAVPLERQGTVHVNTDLAEQLMSLPGIGNTIAKRILEERSIHGAFYYPEDLLSVSGIGVAKLSSIREFIDMSPEGRDE